MSRMLLIIAALGLALSTPAVAQHAGHGAPPPSAPSTDAPAGDPSCSPEHAAMGHCTPARSPGGQVAPPAANPYARHTPSSGEPPTAVDPHASHFAPPAPPDPHAGHAAPAAPTTPLAGDPSCQPEHAAMGHCKPGEPARQQPAAPDPHAGHVMPGNALTASPPVAPPPQEAFSGPEHAADTVFDPELMAEKRAEELIAEHGGYTGYMVLFDRLEYRALDGGDGYAWDAEGWYGGDYNRLWLKTEGEGEFAEAVEFAEVQALYSRAINPWFNLQTGVRYDIKPEPSRTHFVLGVQGLAPYWFEIDAAVFFSDEGDVTGRLEAEYDQRITNRLILQPRVELDLAAQDVPELGIGSGLASAEAGLRLRYEIKREFAPYIGVQYERSFGETADFVRAADGEVDSWSALLGLRSWF
jgi:copper resistance protein B